jgi:hypothetical protein
MWQIGIGYQNDGRPKNNHDKKITLYHYKKVYKQILFMTMFFSMHFKSFKKWNHNEIMIFLLAFWVLYNHYIHSKLLHMFNDIFKNFVMCFIV